MGRQDPEELNTLRSSVVTFQAAIGEMNKQRECHLQKKTEVSAELALFSEKKTQYTRLAEQQKSLVNETGGLERHRDQVRAQLSTLAGMEQEYVQLEQRVCLVGEKRKQLESVRKQKAESDQLKAELRFLETDSANFKARVDTTRTKIAVFDEEAETARIAPERYQVADAYRAGYSRQRPGKGDHATGSRVNPYRRDAFRPGSGSRNGKEKTQCRLEYDKKCRCRWRVPALPPDARESFHQY